MDNEERRNPTNELEIIEHNRKEPVKKPKRKFKGIAAPIAAAMIGSAFTLAIAPQLNYMSDNSTVSTLIEEDTSDSLTAAIATNTTSTVSETDSFVEIVEQANEAIVGIVNMTTAQTDPFSQSSRETESGTGSGVIYKVTDDEAYIVTNNHVIEGASEIDVSLYDGDVVTAELVGADSLTDIAVLKIEGTYEITPLAFGDSESLQTGEEVIAIGNPLGLELSRTVTQGIISAVDRTISVSTSAGEWDLDVIQTDAAINPGNSGGALINAAGELIGINSLKITDSDVEGLGFAIPSVDAAAVIDQITENGQVIRPYIGVGLISLSEVNPYYLQNLSEEVTEGAIIASVEESSPAGKAGLQVEDIIVSIDGQPVTNDDDLRKYLYNDSAVGDVVVVEFYRDNNLQTIKITLESNQQN